MRSEYLGKIGSKRPAVWQHILRHNRWSKKNSMISYAAALLGRNSGNLVTMPAILRSRLRVGGRSILRTPSSLRRMSAVMKNGRSELCKYDSLYDSILYYNHPTTRTVIQSIFVRQANHPSIFHEVDVEFPLLISSQE